MLLFDENSLICQQCLKKQMSSSIEPINDIVYDLAVFLFSFSFQIPLFHVRYHRNNVTNSMRWSSPLNLYEQELNRRESISKFNFKTFLLLWSVTYPHISSGFHLPLMISVAQICILCYPCFLTAGVKIL